MGDIPEERREFVKWLESQVQQSGGLRASASRAGVSHATLLRGLQGDPLSLTTLEGISKWTGVDLIHLLRLYGAQLPEDRHVEAALARLIDQRPQFRDALEMAMETLSDEQLTEVMHFIEFQVQRAQQEE
jgi:transcriptional regulator with XRE-family HTH domain